jgi:hypothetical protein
MKPYTVQFKQEDYKTEGSNSVDIYLTFNIICEGHIVGSVELSHESATLMGFLKTLSISLQTCKSTILLTDFESRKRGAGKLLFCTMLAKLKRLGYRYIILNAVPHSSHKRPAEAADKQQLRLMNYYKSVGFITLDESTGLMRADIKDSIHKCERFKMYDKLSMN